MSQFSLTFKASGKKLGQVILFHGLTGAPVELEELAEFVAGLGYDVVVPCLSGHGTSVEELSKIYSEVWLSEAFEYVEHAISHKGPVILGGLSFGAVLALNCAARFKIEGLVLLAPSLQLRKSWLEALMKGLSYLPEPVLNYLWISRKAARQRLNYRKPRVSYNFHSVGAVARLVKLRRRALSQLKSVRCPVLIVQDPADHYLHPDGVERLVEALDDVGADCIWLPGGEHDLTVGPRFDEVTNAVGAFLERVQGKN